MGDIFFVIILLLVCLIQYINLVRSKYLDFPGEMFARFKLGKNQAIQVDMGSTCHFPCAMRPDSGGVEQSQS